MGGEDTRTTSQEVPDKGDFRKTRAEDERGCWERKQPKLNPTSREPEHCCQEDKDSEGASTNGEDPGP